MSETEYIPFGEEWEKEMMKLSKKQLIGMYRMNLRRNKSTPSPALQDAMNDIARPTFFQELESLINRHSIENASNTPDFILAKYMFASLINWEDACNAREKWYGKEMSI